MKLGQILKLGLNSEILKVTCLIWILKVILVCGWEGQVGISGSSGSLGRYVGQVGRSGMVWYFPIEFD